MRKAHPFDANAGNKKGRLRSVTVVLSERHFEADAIPEHDHESGECSPIFS